MTIEPISQASERWALNWNALCAGAALQGCEAGLEPCLTEAFLAGAPSA